MRALRFAKYGPPSVLFIEELETWRRAALRKNRSLIP
jgi:hypothetical protein